MEKSDLELIKRLSHNDVTLKRLYQQHLDFERRLEKFNNKSYLTAVEEAERKALQKQKLRGRDEIERILLKHRQPDAR